MKYLFNLFAFICITQLVIAQNNTNLGTNAGDRNVSVGYLAGDVVTGAYNTFLGSYAGHSTTSGFHNAFLSYYGGFSNTTGRYNTYAGSFAGMNSKTGHNNTAYGYSAGRLNRTGSGNVFLGYQAGYNEKGSNKLYISNSNTAAPLIYGDFAAKRVQINGFLRSGLLRITPHDPANREGGEIKLEGDGTNFFGWNIDNYDGDLRMIRESGNTGDVFIFNKQGNVGIGTHNPGSFKLAVEGKIGAREIQVTNVNPWPDYVFAQDYKLRSLKEVEAYIQQNQHLPDVPSAKTVKKEGVALGKMNATLLRKIEELTLYIISQDKRLKMLEDKLAKTKKDNK